MNVLRDVHRDAGSSPVVIMGDFNGTTQQIKNWLRRNNLSMFAHNRVTPPNETYHAAGREPSALDHCLISTGWRENCMEGKVFRDVTGSDHWPLMTTMWGLDKKVVATDPPKYNKIDLGRKVGLDPTVITCDNIWETLDLEETDISALTEQFTENCHVIADKLDLHTPPARNNGGQKALALKPGTKRMIARRSKLEKRYLESCNKNPTDAQRAISAEIKVDLLDSVKKSNRMMKTDRIRTWMKSVTKACAIVRGANAKAYWKWTKRVSSNSSGSRSTGVDPIKCPITGELLTDKDKVAGGWEYHSTVLASDETGLSHDKEHWAMMAKDLPFLSELPTNHVLTWSEVCMICFEAMKAGKAPGDVDRVSLEFVRLCMKPPPGSPKGTYQVDPINSMGKYIWALLKKVWGESHFPESWSVNSVLPQKGRSD